MEDIWQGTFRPAQINMLSKSVMNANYIPLYEMTKSHWRLLDWDFLRNAAKNDIVDAAAEDRLVGFIETQFAIKGRGGRYLAPVVESDLPNLAEILDNTRIRNSVDDLVLTNLARGFDLAVTAVQSTMIGRPLAVKAMLLASIADLLHNQQDVDEAQARIEEMWSGDYTDLDITLTWALGFLHDIPLAMERKYEWLQEWADEMDQILGEAEDSGQF
jgi:hypothetical protein